MLESYPSYIVRTLRELLTFANLYSDDEVVNNFEEYILNL